MAQHLARGGALINPAGFNFVFSGLDNRVGTA